VIFEHLRNRDGSGAKLSQFGLGALAQKSLLEMRGQRPDFYLWAENEILKCVPRCLTLAANLIQYLLPFNIASQECSKVRGLVIEKLKNEFENATTASFIQSFDVESSDTLKWLVDEGENISEWLGPLLLRAVRENPQAVFPQILELIGGVSTAAHGDGRIEHSYMFQEEGIALFIGKSERSIIQYLADYEPLTPAWNLQNSLVSSAQIRLLAQNWPSIGDVK